MEDNTVDSNLGTAEIVSAAFPWVRDALIANDTDYRFDASGLPAKFKNLLAEKMAEGATPSEVVKIMAKAQKKYVRLVTEPDSIPHISGGRTSNVKPHELDQWRTWGENHNANKLIRVYLMIQAELENMKVGDVLSMNEIALKISKLNSKNYDNDEILFFEIAKIMLCFWPSNWEKHLNDERISTLVSLVDSGANPIIIKNLIVQFNRK